MKNNSRNTIIQYLEDKSTEIQSGGGGVIGTYTVAPSVSSVLIRYGSHQTSCCTRRLISDLNSISNVNVVKWVEEWVGTQAHIHIQLKNAK